MVVLRRKRRVPPTDVVIELDNADELFAADRRGLLGGARRIDSGMDELLERLLAEKEITAEPECAIPSFSWALQIGPLADVQLRACCCWGPGCGAACRGTRKARKYSCCRLRSTV